MANEFVVRKGLIVTGSARITGSLETTSYVSASAFSGSFSGDGSRLTNLPPVDVSQATTVTASFSSQTSVSVSHNFDSKNVIISVYDVTDAQIIPESVVLTNSNTATVGFPTAQSGYVVVAKGGHIVSGSTDWNNLANVPSGIVSGSSQITDLTTYKETISGNSSYIITHNLNEQYPIVQCWNTVTNRQEIPMEVESDSANQITVMFSSNFTGVVIVKK
jgi:hypothetical protein